MNTHNHLPSLAQSPWGKEAWTFWGDERCRSSWDNSTICTNLQKASVTWFLKVFWDHPDKMGLHRMAKPHISNISKDQCFSRESHSVCTPQLNSCKSLGSVQYLFTTLCIFLSYIKGVWEERYTTREKVLKPILSSVQPPVSKEQHMSSASLPLSGSWDYPQALGGWDQPPLGPPSRTQGMCPSSAWDLRSPPVPCCRCAHLCPCLLDALGCCTSESWRTLIQGSFNWMTYKRKHQTKHCGIWSSEITHQLYYNRQEKIRMS